MSNTLINVGKVGYIEVSIISMDRSITPPEFTVHFIIQCNGQLTNIQKNPFLNCKVHFTVL